MIIAIEGADAAGKATQAALLQKGLQKIGFRPYLASFPDYTTATGKIIQSMLRGDMGLHEGAESELAHESYCKSPRDENALTLQALMAANRYEKFDLLKRYEGTGQQARGATGNDILICDRYWLSGLVYGMADGLYEPWLTSIHAALPSAYHILVDVPHEEALRRRPVLRDRFEKDSTKQQKVRALYASLFDSPTPDLTGRVFRIDGIGDIFDVAERIRSIVDTLLDGCTR